MKLLAGNSNLPLARSISEYLEMPLTDASVRRFADEEVFVEINENVRGEDVFVIQSTSYPANDNLMELLICIDALRRASAKRITAVLPYFGYARQDRKPGPRTPISAKLVANLITVAGASRVLSIDLHAGQIQGFFDIPTDNLFASPVIAADIQARLANRDLLVVSPDVGGVVRARGLAKRLNNAPLAIVDKRREKAGESEVMNIIGDVEGRTCILIDDIVDSAGHALQRRRRAQAAGRDRSVRLLHPRRAVRRRRGPRRQVRAQRAGRDRFDLHRRARPQGRQDPPPDHRPAARRSDPPDRRRKLGLQPVRLMQLDVILKRFEQPDEVREFEKGRFELVAPWRDDHRPRDLSAGLEMVGACRRRAGADVLPRRACRDGRVGLRDRGDGRRQIIEMRAGDIFYIPPGHDSWVVGDEPYVSLHFLGAEDYAAHD